jgi:hypothetical protein
LGTNIIARPAVLRMAFTSPAKEETKAFHMH